MTTTNTYKPAPGFLAAIDQALAAWQDQKETRS